MVMMQKELSWSDGSFWYVRAPGGASLDLLHGILAYSILAYMGLNVKLLSSKGR